MPKLNVLHVEDEKNARLMLADLLGDEVGLTSCESAEAGLDELRTRTFDLTILDWTLPGMDGGEFLRAVREHGRAGRVVVLTAVGTLERAKEAIQAGAYDFLIKPVDPDALLALVDKVGRSVSLLDTAQRASPAVGAKAAAKILGSSPEVLTLKARLELVAASDASVLIVGESGTGKELVARALHEASGRHRQRLVTVNCAAIPESLFESEVFGHKRGAFTGANADRQGLLELAQCGTLFLDEVGELPLGLQAKLLRVLQERRVRRVGDTQDRPVDVRVIAATNRDLEQEVDQGAFREDLLYRLDVVRLDVPPLRERSSDVRELLDHFLARHAAGYERPPVELHEDDLAFLESYPWPGNIRELENVTKQVALLGPQDALRTLRRRQARQSKPDAAAAPPAAPTGPVHEDDVIPLKDAVAEATRVAIIRALKATEGNRTRSAQLLGVSRKTLFNKMQELDIREESSWT